MASYEGHGRTGHANTHAGNALIREAVPLWAATDGRGLGGGPATPCLAGVWDAGLLWFGPRRAGVISLLARHVQKLVRAFALDINSEAL